MSAFPFPYRVADIVATYGDNVIVVRDPDSSFHTLCYAVLVKTNNHDKWKEYDSPLSYNDALATAEECARINTKNGGKSTGHNEE